MKTELPASLNICLVAQKFPILGRAADFGFLWPIARGLARKGHQVTLLSASNPEGREEIVQDEVRAYFLHLREHQSQRLLRSFAESALNKFAQLHARQNFHIVHSVDASAYKIARKRKLFKVAVAYDIEATQMSQIFSILAMAQESLSSLLMTSLAVAYKFVGTYYGRDRALLANADGVFTTSPQQRIALERYYLYPDAKTYTVPYGIEIGDLSPREKSIALRNELSLPASAKVVVTVTDMADRAEMFNLLRAFEMVAVKKPSARLIVVGHGPRFKQIEYEALQLALGGRVVFTGAVKTQDIPDYIALSDVYINISSRTSGFEPSILEAMAQKKVIVGSEVSPLSTIVEDGVDGFLVRPADVLSISRLITQIFEGQQPVSEMGERARRKILALFDMEMMVNQTLDAYHSILQSTGYYKAPKWKIW